jgi:hypothetical protein
MGEPLPENDRPGPDDDSGWPIETDWHMLDAIEEIEARRTSLILMRSAPPLVR